MISRSKYIEVEVSLDEFDSDDLITELKQRGCMSNDESFNVMELIQDIYDRYKLNQTYDERLRDLFYQCLGRIP